MVSEVRIRMNFAKFIRTYYLRRIPLHKQVGCAAPPLPKPRTRAPGETVNSFAMHLRQ